MPDYLQTLTMRLVAGAMRLDATTVARHREFLLASQQPDGGFAGREGLSDPYYTSFALRGLGLCGALDGQAAEAAAEFLARLQPRRLSAVDFITWVESALMVDAAGGGDLFARCGLQRQEGVEECLDRFRAPGGGYTKGLASRSASTYLTFLATACRQAVGATLDSAPPLADLVRARQREDGGFVDFAPLRRGSTNPTSAAVALLKMCGDLDTRTAEEAADFLLGLQNAEGGWRANTRIAVADLLSTFTALVALGDLGAQGRVDARAALRYVRGLERPDGGFRGGSWDAAADVEYTFYGLGALALLA